MTCSSWHGFEMGSAISSFGWHKRPQRTLRNGHGAMHAALHVLHTTGCTTALATTQPEQQEASTSHAQRPRLGVARKHQWHESQCMGIRHLSGHLRGRSQPIHRISQSSHVREFRKADQNRKPKSKSNMDDSGSSKKDALPTQLARQQLCPGLQPLARESCCSQKQGERSGWF